jgi:hypothetical protein
LVLITNSIGRVGCCIVVPDPEPAADALGDGVAAPPHAVATSIPAPTTARRRLLATFHIPCAPPLTRTPLVDGWLNVV